MSVQVSRRGFLLGTAGVGGLLGLGVSPGTAWGASTFQPNVFVELQRDGGLRIICARAEMGQGVRSTLPILIADEMGADPNRVEVVQAIAHERYGDQNTDGSTSVREHYVMLRQMGAVARQLLLTAASAQLGVPVGELKAENHAVVHTPSGRSVPFGDLSEAASRLPVPAPDEVPLRPTRELEHMGTELPLLDARAYVTGEALFGADVVLPGMVFAVVARPPVLGAAVDQVDSAEALAVPGVLEVITLPSWSAPGRFHGVGGVAVVAQNTWAALEGRRRLKISWTRGSHEGIDSAAEYAAMHKAVQTPGSAFREKGDADEALDLAATRHDATYRIPHLVHAPLEPPAAIVWRKESSCEVYAPVQNPQLTHEWVGKVTGLSGDAVVVNQTFLGAAFGRKSKPDFVVEAAHLSERLRVPVRVQWTREDDIRHSYYHACSVQRLDAGFDAAGKAVAWRHRIASPSITTTFVPLLHGMRTAELAQGALDLPLDVPNLVCETHTVVEHVRIGWMRSVYNINHAFAIQCFFDELAVKQKISTPEMAKRLLGPPRKVDADDLGANNPNYGSDDPEHIVDTARYHRVIDTVVARSGYGRAPPEGTAFGFAVHRSFLTYAAVVVAVSRDPRGGPKVERAWVVADAGQVMNLDRVHAQMEGAVVFGASIALYGEITLDGGAVVQSNYHDYPVLRIGECPVTDVHFVGGEHPPGGVGEPGVPPVAPAIANAWFHLTGERVRELPLRAASVVR